MQTGSGEQVNNASLRVLPAVQALHYPVELHVEQSVVLAEQSLQVWVALVVVSRYLLPTVQTGSAEQVNNAASRVLPAVQALHYPVESHVAQLAVLNEQSLQVWMAVEISRY